MPRRKNASNKKSLRSLMRTGMLALFLILLLIAAVSYYSGALTPAPPSQPQEQDASVPVPSNTPRPTPTPAPVKTPEAQSPNGQTAEGKLAFYALSVGKADALVLISPSGRVMMVDAGETDAYPVIDAFFKEKGIKRIDALVATHPHSDHIGSMRKVLTNYDVGRVYMSPATHTTSLYTKLLDTIEQRKIPLELVTGGMSISWDAAVTVDVLAPAKNKTYKNLNNTSVVLKLTYGSTSFLLTGDAEKESEKEMLEAYQDELKSDVLKAAHHGSKTSSTKAFVQAVAPRIAVVTDTPGDNELHPDPAVVKRLTGLKAQILRTSGGTVCILSDGKDIRIVK